MNLIDIGCNLTHDSFDGDRAAVLQRARDAGVVQMIVTGASEAGSRGALELARSHPGELFATAGVHPHLASEFHDGTEALLRERDLLDGVRFAEQHRMMRHDGRLGGGLHHHDRRHCGERCADGGEQHGGLHRHDLPGHRRLELACSDRLHHPRRPLRRGRARQGRRA